MKRTSLLLVLLAWGEVLFAQSPREKVKDGNKNYQEGAFDQAEINYREALKKGKDHQGTINFNLGDALYKQERFEEAFKAFEESLAAAESKADKAAAYHNLGNSYLKQKKLKEAIQSYKQALINNPADEETRYNLAKALEQKKQEEQQQQEQKQDQKNKDQDQDQEKDQNQDQDQDQQDQKDQKDQNKDENQDQKNQDQQDQQDSKQNPNDPKEQQAKDQQAEMNRKNAERLLQALDRDEEKLQKELMKKKIKAKPLKSAKDW